MQIVTRSALFSYSPLPSVPLLTAPPPPKQLCAPRIAGLLPARVSARAEIVLEIPPTREEVLRQLGPIRSREEMNAEIAELTLDAAAFLAGLHNLRESCEWRARHSRSGSCRYEQ